MQECLAIRREFGQYRRGLYAGIARVRPLMAQRDGRRQARAERISETLNASGTRRCNRVCIIGQVTVAAGPLAELCAQRRVANDQPQGSHRNAAPHRTKSTPFPNGHWL
ncbi:hypothetical protein K466DRAFT_409349 [Polyporus arcularius HHB13444]|uniref:Uncharacterized protein n=1 Tax=Polyporus arcularius HHB13444 TaxID=1314778 RepID=A0A5C3PJP7_9APHY|nr:hypothetical protein K466DRAFT_409349 [Polyporus arcularius HHB13444]